MAEPFLASNGNMGSDLASANEFLNRHKHFATEVINKEHDVHAILNRVHELPEEDRRALRDFQQRYESLKQTLEWRIQLGNTYQQVRHLFRCKKNRCKNLLENLKARSIPYLSF